MERGSPARLLERAEAEGRVEHEGWLIRRSGAVFWASAILSAIKDRDGQLRGVSVVMRDLTERMRAERAQSLLSDLGTALAGSLDSATVLDRVAHLATRTVASCCIVELLQNERIEPVAVAHVDEGQEQLLRSQLKSLSAEARRARGVASVVRSGEPELISDASDTDWLAEGLGLDVHGAFDRLEPGAYMCVPLTARGKTFGAMVFLAAPDKRYTREDLMLGQEFARRAAIAIDNARLYEQAQMAIRMREEILAVVSHDLRSPLSTIQMGAERILAEQRAGAGMPSTEKSAKMIRNASDQMTRLIRDLLDFTSIETGHLRIELKECDANALADEAVELMRPVAADKGVRLDIETAAKDTLIRCDSGRIVQVLSNLLGNALKFTPEGQAIVAQISVEQDHVVFSVSDTGPGIPQEHLTRVFERYWRADSKARDGLGLAISKAIVESHGGTIWAARLEEQSSVTSIEWR